MIGHSTCEAEPNSTPWRTVPMAGNRSQAHGIILFECVDAGQPLQALPCLKQQKRSSGSERAARGTEDSLYGMHSLNRLQSRSSFIVLLGFAFAFLPTFGPFLALFFIFSQTIALDRRDSLWLLAALLLALPLAIHTGAAGFAFGAAQILAPWLVYRAFGLLPQLKSKASSRALSIGLLIGLSCIVILGWLQNAQLDFKYRTLAQAISWESNPALYAHTVLVLGCVITLLAPSARMRIGALALSAFGILVSGSQEAGLAWLLFALLLPLVSHDFRARYERLFYYAMVAILLTVSAALGSLLGWGRVGFLVDVVPQPETAKNLVQASEWEMADWWLSHGVTVTGEGVDLAGQQLRQFNITKTSDDFWLRLQQVIPIQAGTPYTVSTWILNQDTEVRPGFQGWGELQDSGTTFSITASFTPELWRATASGPGIILDYGVAETYGPWQRVWATFQYDGNLEPLHFFIGLTPDNRNVPNTVSSFAGFQLEQGSELTPYIPGKTTRGVGLGAGRLPYWSAALQGFRENAIFGTAEPFPEFFSSFAPQRSRIHELPAHPHNFFLDILYSRGLLGAAGFMFLIIALGWSASHRRDFALLLVLATVLLANSFDTTFFYGGVLYPLAAIAGWRSTGLESSELQGHQSLKLFITRISLAAAGYVAGLLALLVALSTPWLLSIMGSGSAPAGFSAPNPVVLYALLLWPVLTWREGLDPGYGLSAPQELKKQVSATLLASLLLALGASLFPASINLSIQQVLLIAALSVVFLPVLHALTKRLLLLTGFWGKDVVILGAGEVGQQVISALNRNPLAGLKPVAVFDDDPAKSELRLEGVTVKGTLTDAMDYAKQHGISHAIVAIPSLSPGVLARLVDRSGRGFKRLQFIPDLMGLPAEDVHASNLDGMLAIEVHNGLYSRTNQLLKRLMDLVGASLAALVFSPILLGIYVLIRLDSRGPGFYLSERVGVDGIPFKCLKFRTMFVDADERLQQMLREDPAVRAEYETFHKLDDDPRVTRIGRILRRYSLDEFAQLWNVFTGEMSLVGARPYMVREIPAMSDYGEVILQAKPGITGLWQVSGRNELSFQERLELESHYVRNWTIWWDIIILAQTIDAVLSSRGAK